MKHFLSVQNTENRTAASLLEVFKDFLCMLSTSNQIMNLQKLCRVLCRTDQFRSRIRIRFWQAPDADPDPEKWSGFLTKERGTTLPVCSSAGFACWRGRWWPLSRRGRPPSCPGQRIASSWWPGRACCSVAAFAWPRGRKNCRDSPKAFSRLCLTRIPTGSYLYFYAIGNEGRA